MMPIVLIAPVLVWGINTLLEGYRITSSGRDIDAHGVCKNVKSTDGNDYFAPTKTALEWNSFLNNHPNSITLSSCADQRGCKLKYRIKTSTATSTWAETDWGSANGGDWVYGPAVYATGDKTTVSYEVALMCDEEHSMTLGYRYRGNQGPYWNTSIGTHSSDRFATSTTLTWSYGGFTDPYPKSCAIRGGDGGCGMLIYESNESGPLICDASIQFDFVRWAPGYVADKYGSSQGGNTCPTEGCSLEMGIRCFTPTTSCSEPTTLLANGSSSHTVSDCEIAGGTVYDGGTEGCVRKFTNSYCPSTWTQYNNWSTTTSNTCSDYQCSSCTTGSHTFSDTAVESCRYSAWSGGDGGWCTSAYCRASVTEIGCY